VFATHPYLAHFHYCVDLFSPETPYYPEADPRRSVTYERSTPRPGDRCQVTHLGRVFRVLITCLASPHAPFPPAVVLTTCPRILSSVWCGPSRSGRALREASAGEVCTRSELAPSGLPGLSGPERQRGGRVSDRFAPAGQVYVLLRFFYSYSGETPEVRQ